MTISEQRVQCIEDQNPQRQFRFEVSNEEIPTFTPRTKLYSLEPCEDGTPWVEGLSGYLVRLADEHHVKVGDLIGRILSEVENPYGNILPPAERRLAAATTRHDLPRYDYTVNGATGIAERMAFALEELTGLRNLRAMTFVPYRSVLWAFAFNEKRSWCPVCLHEWRANNTVVYEPLFWTCATTKTCPIHCCSLASTCPQCKHSVAGIAVGSRIGYCGRCGIWLGREREALGTCQTEADAESLSEQSQIIDLIRMIPRIQPERSQTNWRQSLQIAIDTVANGSVGTFAKYLQMDDSTIVAWLEGRWVPRVASALRISSALGVELSCLFGPSPLSATQLEAAQQTVANTDATRVRYDRDQEQMRAELASSLKREVPETLTEVAQRLGLKGPSRLRRADPDAAQAIVERFMTLRGKRPHHWSNKDSARRSARARLIREIGSEIPRSIEQLATNLGVHVSTLQYHFPELCLRLKARREEAENRERAVIAVAMSSAAEEIPPPTIAEMRTRLNHGVTMLKSCAPAAYQLIVERGAMAEQIRRAELGRRMEMALEENPPPKLREVIERLGTNGNFMRVHHPDLVRKVATRFREYEADEKKERQATVVNAIQVVVNDLRAVGISPTHRQIRERLERLAINYSPWGFSSLIARAVKMPQGPKEDASVRSTSANSGGAV